ncbi:DNA cytosine methyltransferase [Lysobacter gummosus]|uniref:DNA cytosine methyltransferase n=1 Tax=Lysobacter gummosus TaxID=262324 RepID=UPI00362B344E
MKVNSAALKHKPLAIDLFSGCGGLSAGLKKAGFKVVAACEYDEKAQDTYSLNHPDVKLYSDDIRAVPAARILADLKLRPGQVDLLAGCPPCQGFSRMRTRNQRSSVRDERNNLVSEFMRFVRVLKPKTVMMENVPALISDHRFRKICRELKALRYELVAEILDAADYLVPQRRKRMILLASRVHTPTLAKKSKRKITVRDALEGIESPARSKDEIHKLGENRSDRVKRIIRLIPKNGGSRSDLPKSFELDCHKKFSGFSDVYGRMSWDSVSPTITSGCTNPSKGRFLHPRQNRTITLREAALLQGFSKGYKFNCLHGKEAIALMIGNALPPPFIAAHARELRKALID